MKTIFGLHAVEEILKQNITGTLYLIEGKDNQRIDRVLENLNSTKNTLIYLSKKAYSDRFKQDTTGSVSFEFDGNYPFEISEEAFFQAMESSSSDETVLLLDGIKDIGNLGSIIRSALLFDVNYIVIPKNNAASVNEVVIKRSAGAVFKLKIIYVTNLVRVIERLKKNGFWIYGADMHGEDMSVFDYSPKTAIVMGEEGEGLRRLVEEKCDVILSIPMNDKLDSLNVSVSAGILLYDRFIKKRNQ